MNIKDEKDVNEIIPNLWLGNIKAAYNKPFLKKYNIDCVISIIDEFDPKYKYDGINYIYIPIKDKLISQNQNLTHLFNTTNDYINKKISESKSILVHCKKGHHRSASLVAAYLIKHKGFNYHNALDYINKQRPFAFKRPANISKELFRYNLYLNNINNNNFNSNIVAINNGKYVYFTSII